MCVNVSVCVNLPAAQRCHALCHCAFSYFQLPNNEFRDPGQPNIQCFYSGVILLQLCLILINGCSGRNHRCSPSCRCLRTLTSCRLKVKSSCSRRTSDWVERAGWRSPHAGCPGTMSPRDRAFKTRLSCRCLRSSSSHNHARLASRRSLFCLRSVVIGEENPQYMESPFLPPALAKLEFV